MDVTLLDKQMKLKFLLPGMVFSKAGEKEKYIRLSSDWGSHRFDWDQEKVPELAQCKERIPCVRLNFEQVWFLDQDTDVIVVGKVKTVLVDPP